MKPNAALTILILALALLGCSKTETKVDAVNEMFPDEQEQVKNTLIHIIDLSKNQEVDSVESYHLYGPKFTKFDDGEIIGRQDAAMAEKSERELFTSVSDFSYTLDDLKADVFDDMAITTFIMNGAFTMGDYSGTFKSRGTIVFVKVDGKWKITHEHFSPYGSPPVH